MTGFGLEGAYLRNFAETDHSLCDLIQTGVGLLSNAIEMHVSYIPALDSPFMGRKLISEGATRTDEPHFVFPVKCLRGTQIGKLICASPVRHRVISASEKRIVASMARLIAANIIVVTKAMNPKDDTERDLVKTLTRNRFTQLFQPIRRLSDMNTVGFEALTRFPDLTNIDTLQAFRAARRLGLGPQFDTHAAMQIVGATLSTVQDRGYISFNASHQTLMLDTITTLYEWKCKGLPQAGYVIEISEQDAIKNFDILRARIAKIRELGMKLAIDDVGAGQTGFQHILRLEPDMIKIDRSVTAGIVTHKGSRAMLNALTNFGAQTDCEIVCEGVETDEQLTILRDIGVPFAQGYLLGRPAPLPEHPFAANTKLCVHSLANGSRANA
jgi:EAL domain-containing protein (putative c-di-GMP-specific phosphodiesterase class I)